MKACSRWMAWLPLILALGLIGCNDSSNTTSQPVPLVAPAPSATPTSLPSVTLNFLNADSIAIAKAIEPPPGPDSATNQTEIAEILELQKTRTVAQCIRANSEATAKFEYFFSPPYGPLKPADVQALIPFFDKVTHDASYFVNQGKNYFLRKRPYVESQEIQPCIPLSGTTDSYPSGHSTYSRLFADILSEMDPAHETKYQNRAEQIREDRVTGGLHHPSDIAAGVILGDEIFQAMSADDSFQKELAELKAQVFPEAGKE